MVKVKKLATAALVGAAIAGSAAVLSKKENRKKLAKLTQQVKKQGSKALAELEKTGSAVAKLVKEAKKAKTTTSKNKSKKSKV